MRGPVAFLAESRTRLVVGTVGMLGPLAGFAHWLAGYIRNDSNAPGLDVLLLTGWMLGAFCAAYVGAILVGDFLFGKVWRETTFLNRRVDVEHADLATLESASRNRTLHFSLLVVAILGVFVVGTHKTTDSFLPWYARYGYATSTLRGDNTAEKVAILREMTQAQDDRLIGNAKLIVDALDADEDKVATQALWSIGEVARRTYRSLELMENGVEGGDWIFGLKAFLEREVQAKLEAKVGLIAEEPTRAPALIYGLIAMQSQKGFIAIRTYLKGDRANDELTRQIILSVAEQRSVQLVGSLVPVLLDEDTALVKDAAWAIGEVFGMDTTDFSMVCARSTGALRIRCSLLEDAFEQSTKAFTNALVRIDPNDEAGLGVHCGILDALQRTRPAAVSDQLMALFDGIQPVDRRCPRTETRFPFQGSVLQSAGEEYREKVVKTMAAVAQGNETIIDWLRKRSADEAVASGIRADMRHILDVITDRRNR